MATLNLTVDDDGSTVTLEVRYSMDEFKCMFVYFDKWFELNPLGVNAKDLAGCKALIDELRPLSETMQ